MAEYLLNLWLNSHGLRLTKLMDNDNWTQDVCKCPQLFLGSEMQKVAWSICTRKSAVCGS